MKVRKHQYFYFQYLECIPQLDEFKEIFFFILLLWSIGAGVDKPF